MTIAEFLGTQLFMISDTPITVGSVVTFLVILLLSVIASSILQRIARRTLERMGLVEPGTMSTILRLLHYAVVIVGFAVAVQAIGISLASLFAAGAVVAVAIGFALQNVLQNFVSGVILLAERSITENDVLEVQGEMVVVERLGARATVARTRDDDQIIIPNSVLVQSSVTNLTLADNVHRIRCTVGVSYGSDMVQVEQVLLEAARSLADRTTGRAPVAMLLQFGDSSVVWELSIWIENPWTAPTTRSDLNKAIWNHLKDAGITIAYPQLDLHLISTPGAGPGAASPSPSGP